MRRFTHVQGWQMSHNHAMPTLKRYVFFVGFNVAPGHRKKEGDIGAWGQWLHLLFGGAWSLV